ncbi:response regulator [Marisediminicola sp. LYQ134]|uniref:response regulator n=1 Tax=Marisediminicola sp. LYQ134 TaxID=3391061 RepID=UPI0039830A0E
MSGSAATGAGAMRVIIADDDDDLRDLVSITVARAGLELVAAVADGESAWSAVVEHRPDIVLLDVAMPGMTGLEVSRRIRADLSLAPVHIVLISAGVDSESHAEGWAAGADDYLIKPFSPRVLIEKLVAVAAPSGLVS